MMLDKKECEQRLADIESLIQVAARLLNETITTYNYSQTEANMVEAMVGELSDVASIVEDKIRRRL